LILLTASAGCKTTTNLTTAPTPSNQQQIEIVSVFGPLKPINPGGPIIEITLKNIGSEPVISLSATIELNKSFVFSYDVTALNPLLTGKTVSVKLSLIGAGYDDSLYYPLTINGTIQNGVTFIYTNQVRIGAK